MWNEVLNLVAGTIGIGISTGLLAWLTYYAFEETPNNKELEEQDNEMHK
jgi:hypothetical protein